jgi:hypothetical protein
MRITRETVVRVAGALALAALAFAAGFYSGLAVAVRGCEEGSTKEWGASGALRLSTEQLLLVQLPGRYAAIQLLARGDNYAKVRWWLQRERGSRFDPATVESGTVTLRETYVPGTATRDSLGLSDPTTSTIRLGDVTVNWSRPNWFYYGREYGLHLIDQRDIARVVVHEWFEWTYVR